MSPGGSSFPIGVGNGLLNQKNGDFTTYKLDGRKWRNGDTWWLFFFVEVCCVFFIQGRGREMNHVKNDCNLIGISSPFLPIQEFKRL